MKTGVNLLKIILVQIVDLTRRHEVGITSNRESERHGEFMYLSLIHTARHMLGGSFILRKIK